MDKRLITLLMFVGGAVGGYVPALWGDDGFTMSAVDVALAIPAPQTNGSSLAGWSLSSVGTSGMAFFVNNATLQDIIFYGFVIGTPA
jgi:hypothetical protein